MTFFFKIYTYIYIYSCHIFYSRRVVDIPDGKPKWDGLNDQSDLIEDSPQELNMELKKKKRKREDNDEGGEEKKQGN